MFCFLQSINSKATKVFEILLVVMFSVMVVSCFMQVVTRFLGMPLSWSEELSRYMAIYLTFLGACYSYRKGGLIAVEILREKFKGKKKDILIIFITIVTMIFCVIMIRYGLFLAIKFMSQTSPAMQIPIGLIYLVAPIFGLILILFSVEQLILQLRQPKEEV